MKATFIPLRPSLVLATALLAGLTPASAQPASTASAAADEPLVLSPFRVDTSKDVGYYASTSITATRLNTPIKELPMAVEVVTKEFIEDIGAVDFKEALQYSAGVVQDFVQSSNNFLFSPSGTGQATGALSRDSVALNIRGFNTRFVLRNGFRTDTTTDIANIDRQEIMRGPAALLYGVSALGGIVNLMPRVPHATPRYSVRLGYGSFDYARAELGASGRLWRSRGGAINVNYAVSGVYQKLSDYTDFDDRVRRLVLPAFDVQLGPKTRLFVDVEIGSLKNIGNGFKDVNDAAPGPVINEYGLATNNLNAYNETVTVARDRLGRDQKFRWSGGDVFSRVTTTNYTGTLEHQFLPNLNLSAGVNYNDVNTRRLTLDSQATNLIAQAAAPTTLGRWVNTGVNPLNPAQNLWKTVSFQWGNGRVDKNITQTRLDLNYSFEKCGRHTFVVGRHDSQVKQWSLATAQVTTNLNADGNRSYVAWDDTSYIRYQGERIRPFRDTFFKEWDTGHYAVYMGKFWSDRITVVGGYRWDRYMVRQLDYTYVKADSTQPDSAVSNWVLPATYDASANSALGAVPAVQGYRFGGKVQREGNPSAGVNIVLTKHVNFYLMNAAGVFPNTGQRDGAGNAFAAEKTKGLEFGLKSEFMADAQGRPRLAASVGMYRINRENGIYNVFWAPQPRSNDRRRVRTGVTTGPVFGTGAGAYSAPNSGYQDFETNLPVTYLLPAQYVAAADLNHPRVTGAPQQSGYILVDYASLGTAASDPLRRAMDAAANDASNATALQTTSVGSGAAGLYANNGYINRNSDTSYDDASRGFDCEIVFSPTENYSLRLTYAYTQEGVTGGFRVVDQPKSTEYDSWWNYMGVPLETRRANLDESSYDFSGQIKGVRLIDNPRNMAGVWNKYTFTRGPLKGLDLGLGVNWSSQRQSELLITNGLRSNIAGVENIRRKPKYPEHITLNAGVGYRLRMSGRTLNLRLNVNNLLDDRKDVSNGSSTLFVNPATGTTVASTTPGARQITVPERVVIYFAPLSFRLSASMTF